MRKILSSLFAIAVIASLSSCQKEIDSIDNNNGVDVLFTTDEEVFTKTYMHSNVDGSYAPRWNGGETLHVSFDNKFNSGADLGEKNVNEYALVGSTSNGTIASFSGSANLTNGSHTVYGYIASSPKKVVQSGYRVDISEQQSPVFIESHGYSIDPDQDILVVKPFECSVSDGSTTSNGLRFKRVESIIRLVFKGATELEANGESLSDLTFKVNGHKLVGAAVFDIETGEYKTTTTSKDYISISSFDESYPIVIGSEGHNEVMLSVLPETIAANSGITITATTSLGKTIIFERPIHKSISLTQSNVTTINVNLTNDDIISEGDEDTKPKTGSLVFGTNNAKITSSSVTVQDNINNEWTITTTGTSSYTASAEYYQVGSSSKPATKISFVGSMPSSVNVTSVKAKFGGFSGTAGKVSIKVGGVEIASGNLNEASVVDIESTSAAIGDQISIEVTGISKGVKVYSITYTIEPTGNGNTDPEPSEKQLIGIETTGTPSEFWTGDEFNTNGIIVTALWEDESTTEVTSECTFSGYDMSTAGDQTVTVSYKGETTTYSIHVNTISNTKETAYTATEAVGLINAGKGLNTAVYVKGTVSKIVSDFNSQFGNISFNISEGEGENAVDFEFFRNFKGADKEKWSSKNEAPAVGDFVVGYGKLTKYDSTYEFAEGNYIVDITRVEREDIEATLSIADITIKQGEDINPNIVTNVEGEYLIEYTSNNEDVVIADGDELVCGDETGTATITATLVADGYTTAETTFTITVTPKGSDPVYTLDATNEDNQGTNNGYASSCDIEVDGITWNVTGNSTMSPWRIGGKNITKVDRTVYSKTAYARAISSIDLTLGAASSVTINSCKLVFSTNEDFSNSSEVPFIYANGKISITRDGGFPANCYFKFVFNVTIGGSNKFIEFKKVEFYE